MFRNQKILDLFSTMSERVVKVLLPVLYRDGKLHWNPTVNKMTAMVLKKLMEMDSTSFEVFFTIHVSMLLLIIMSSILISVPPFYHLNTGTL